MCWIAGGCPQPIFYVDLVACTLRGTITMVVVTAKFRSVVQNLTKYSRSSVIMRLDMTIMCPL